MFKINLNFDLLKYIKFSLYLLPFFLITGPFIAEIVIFVCSMYFILDTLKKKKINFYHNNFNLGFFTFFILINVSSMFSNDFETSFLKSLFYIRFYLFFYFINTFFTSEDYKNFNFSIILAVVFVIIDIFIQFTFGKDIFGYAPGMGGLRYQGPFGDEWISGGYLKIFCIIAVVFLFLNLKNNNKVKLSNIFILFSLLAIFLSGEKMAFILFTLFIVLFYLTYIKNFLTTLCLFLAAFSIIGTYIFIKDVEFDSKSTKLDKLVYRYNQQFVSILGFDSNSKKAILDTVHGIHLITAYEIFKQNKFLGSGIKTYRIVCNDIDPKIIIDYGVSHGRAVNNRCTSHPHNFFMEILSETGFLGLLGYLFFLFIILKNFNWKFKQNPNYNIPYFFSFIIYVFPFATSGSFFNNYNSIIFWIILSFMFFQNKKLNY